jgi:hypothetical protein
MASRYRRDYDQYGARDRYGPSERGMDADAIQRGGYPYYYSAPRSGFWDGGSMFGRGSWGSNGSWGNDWTQR